MSAARNPRRIAAFCSSVGATALVGLLLVTALPSFAAGKAVPRVLGELPHDPRAFTQGLLLHEGVFYESTGVLGQSTLRRVEPSSGAVLARRDLRADLFGEGLARVGDRLIQLTWVSRVALIWDRRSFELLGTSSYEGQGWGLCHDGERLIMSDGSDRLQFRDPATFALLGLVRVTSNGRPVQKLNELECVDGAVYANVWETDRVLGIDPGDGKVQTEIDASGLLAPQDALDAGVLNGIAYDPLTGRFYLTGKNWPKVFEVVFESLAD